jgi:hypothetical protein
VEVLLEEVVAGRFMRCSPGKNNNTTSAAAPAPAIHIGRRALTAGASLVVAVTHIACAALTTGVSLPNTAIHTGWAALTAGASLAVTVLHMACAALSVATNFADEALYVGLTSPTILISVADTAIHTNAKDLRSRGASQEFASSSVSPTISNLRAQPVFSTVNPLLQYVLESFQIPRRELVKWPPVVFRRDHVVALNEHLERAGPLNRSQQ